jgi:hypothetical protein
LAKRHTVFRPSTFSLRQSIYLHVDIWLSKAQPLSLPLNIRNSIWRYAFEHETPICMRDNDLLGREHKLQHERHCQDSFNPILNLRLTYRQANHEIANFSRGDGNTLKDDGVERSGG